MSGYPSTHHPYPYPATTGSPAPAPRRRAPAPLKIAALLLAVATVVPFLVIDTEGVGHRDWLVLVAIGATVFWGLMAFGLYRGVRAIYVLVMIGVVADAAQSLLHLDVHQVNGQTVADLTAVLGAAYGLLMVGLLSLASTRRYVFRR